MIVAWINKLDDAALTAAGLVSNLPIENAQVLPLALPARITGTSMTIGFDHGASTGWDLFAVLPARQGGDLTPAATVRVTLSEIAIGGTDVHDSGTVSAGVIDGYPQVYHRLPTTKTARYGEITLTDASLAFLDVGRLAGYGGQGYWEPAWGHILGRPVEFADLTVKRRTLGGQVIRRRGARFRRAGFTLEDESVADMFGQAFALDRRAGHGDPILVMLDPDNRPQEESLYGAVAAVTPMTRHRKLGERKTYVIEEEL